MSMIIGSMLDNDVYKFYVQKAILSYHRSANVSARYVFQDRRPYGKFNQEFATRLAGEIDGMARLRLTDTEADWLLQRQSFLGRQYLEYLRNYRFNPDEVDFSVADGNLTLEIVGDSWARCCLWEVPLLAIISELYFRHCDTAWAREGQNERLQFKAAALDGLMYAELGTRRRRSYDSQDCAVCTLARCGKSWFLGTSNAHFAMKYGVKATGTVPHEWPMGVSAIDGLRGANYHAFARWAEIFQGNANLALPDTFGSGQFFRDCGRMIASQYAGLRQDSGDPHEFAANAERYYLKHSIAPNTKIVSFTDSLTPAKCWEIQRRWGQVFRCRYGIGTHFTNDFDTPALNMVIKLANCDGVPVVKLSDTPSKASGTPDALRVARWTFDHAKLDP